MAMDGDDDLDLDVTVYNGMQIVAMTNPPAWAIGVHKLNGDAEHCRTRCYVLQQIFDACERA